jgi:hypothetical protein
VEEERSPDVGIWLGGESWGKRDWGLAEYGQILYYCLSFFTQNWSLPLESPFMQ